ncbi:MULTISPECIES: hypothetical protein [unclassified Arthrobacter]|uniref:hypothetical protein n=1 Tax=unclassified Arthrobacter TaxID=235627 RepID=UPI0006FF7913|nr:hypothetical protein [Arthrobacter sp. Leaf234]KQO03981.1 hypothetical protein ASF21_07175 [Arthrobacter sp. Leaf234]
MFGDEQDELPRGTPLLAPAVIVRSGRSTTRPAVLPGRWRSRSSSWGVLSLSSLLLLHTSAPGLLNGPTFLPCRPGETMTG